MDQNGSKSVWKASFIVGAVSLIITVISAITGVLDIIRENLWLRIGLIGATIILLILAIKISDENNNSEASSNLCKSINCICIGISVFFIFLAIIGAIETFADKGNFESSLWPKACAIRPTISPTPIPDIENPFDKIAAGDDFSMLLTSAKKVITYGRAEGIDTSGWEDIVQISAYEDHAIGLREDGSVIVTGSDREAYDVSDWGDIKQVVACCETVIGVTNHGKVVMAGPCRNCLIDSLNWTNVDRILGAAELIVAQKANYTLIAVDQYTNWGELDFDQAALVQSGAAVRDWMLFVLGNGTIKTIGDGEDLEYDASGWRNMAGVSGGDGFLVGLKTDGTACSAGNPPDILIDVSGWTELVAVCAGKSHAIGLCKDGTVVSTGDNTYDQRDIENGNYWTEN